MSKFDMVDAVMSYLDKYQVHGSYNYKDVLATFEQIDSDYRNDEAHLKIATISLIMTSLLKNYMSAIRHAKIFRVH